MMMMMMIAPLIHIFGGLHSGRQWSVPNMCVGPRHSPPRIDDHEARSFTPIMMYYDS